MNTTNTEICEEVLVQIRKIVRAMSVHSRQLQRQCALTAPQLVLLREIVGNDNISIGALAKQASLSNATVTGIIDRLEQRELVARVRNGQDRRQVLLTSTEAGRELCAQAPSLLQERFIGALTSLEQWEQAQMLSVVSRMATMMGGEPTDESRGAPMSSESDGFIEACRMLLEQDGSQAPGGEPTSSSSPISMVAAQADEELPTGLSREELARFLNLHLRPYEDTVEDIARGLDYAFSRDEGRGGFVLLALADDRLVGALVMLDTGMSGYVPEHLLLFVAVDGALRGRGIGAGLIKSAQERCGGNIKLHVEYDNPARRLYGRMGFTSKYAEMRWNNEPRHHQS